MFVQQILAILVLVKTLEIDGFPTSSKVDETLIGSVDVAMPQIQTIEVRKSRASKGRKYVPLNSLTLSRHTGDSASENEGQKTEMEADANDMKPPAKRPWWQSLPPNKNKKNKVILDEYDKLKSSLPKWPWIEALKSSSSGDTPLTRKNVQDKVRVVMADKGSSSTMISMTSETTTPMIETASPIIVMADHLEDKSTPEKMMSDEIDHEMMKPNKMMMKDKMKPEKMNDQKKKDEMVHEMDQMHKIALEMKKKSKMTTTSTTITTSSTTTKKPQGLPSWLASLQSDMESKASSSTTSPTASSTSSTTEEPDWFSNIFSSSANAKPKVSTTTTTTSTTKKPFKMPDFANLNKPDNKITMKKDPMMKEEVPMVKINGPTIHLPSFPLISDQLKLFSSNSATMEDHDHDDMDMAEQRTAAIITGDEDFNLNFFPMRESAQDVQARFPLLANQHDLGDLEGTTEQVPLDTQSLSPMENREALTQLVSLYEWAPTMKGEKDKTDPQALPMEKEKKPMKKDNMEKKEMMDKDNMEEHDDKVHMYSSGGIPHSVTLQLANNKKPKPTAQKIDRVEKPSYLVPDPEPGMLYTEPKQDVPMNVKQTLALILQQNRELTTLLQRRLNEQSRLISILMEQIQW